MDGDSWGVWRWNDAGGYGDGWIWEEIGGGGERWIVATRTQRMGGGTYWWTVHLGMAHRKYEAWPWWEWANQREFNFS